jgi:hypothetical protein
MRVRTGQQAEHSNTYNLNLHAAPVQLHKKYTLSCGKVSRNNYPNLPNIKSCTYLRYLWSVGN